MAHSRVRVAFVVLAAAVAGPLACSDESASGGSSPNEPSSDGGSGGPSGTSSSGSTTPGSGATDGGAEPAGPRVMVRLGNYARPTFLDLDACFGRTVDGVTTWSGPFWRDDWARGASFRAVTAYRRIPAGPQQVRFVSHESNECTTGILGLPDQTLDVPLLPAGQEDAWYTVMLTGTVGDPALTIKTLTDRETSSDTPYALRLVSTSASLGTLELGTLEDDDFVSRIQNVGYDTPSAYTSWDKKYETPLYFGYQIRAQGQSSGAPLIAGDRLQSEATARGSWSVFVVPKVEASGNESYAICADGSDAPRLCYPCGRPSCEGL